LRLLDFFFIPIKELVHSKFCEPVLNPGIPKKNRKANINVSYHYCGVFCKYRRIYPKIRRAMNGVNTRYGVDTDRHAEPKPAFHTGRSDLLKCGLRPVIAGRSLQREWSGTVCALSLPWMPGQRQETRKFRRSHP
jgi:hypothetical protein